MQKAIALKWKKDKDGNINDALDQLEAIKLVIKYLFRDF